MKPTKHIAVLIETSRAYGRGLLRGVCGRFHREQTGYLVDLFKSPKTVACSRSCSHWLKTWLRGDGILGTLGWHLRRM